MQTTASALAVAAILLAATIAAPAAGLDDGFVTNALVGKPAADAQQSPPTSAPEQGYIAYSDYGAALPAPGCYWARMPIYDAKHNVIGWRGRPLAVCP
jgi:hypothetical protein